VPYFTQQVSRTPIDCQAISLPPPADLVSPSRRVIVLSVRDDQRGKVEAFDIGAHDYVTKPTGTEELVACIRTAFRHRVQAQGAAPLFVLGELTGSISCAASSNAPAPRCIYRRRNTTCWPSWWQMSARC
jgi:hypothetical protein